MIRFRGDFNADLGNDVDVKVKPSSKSRIWDLNLEALNYIKMKAKVFHNELISGAFSPFKSLTGLFG